MPQARKDTLMGIFSTVIAFRKICFAEMNLELEPQPISQHLPFHKCRQKFNLFLKECKFKPEKYTIKATKIDPNDHIHELLKTISLLTNKPQFTLIPLMSL